MGDMINGIFDSLGPFIIPGIIILFVLIFGSLFYFICRYIWKETKKLKNINTLLWEHGNHSLDGNDTLKYLHVPTKEEYLRNRFREEKWQWNKKYYEKYKGNLTPEVYEKRLQDAEAGWDKVMKIPEGAPTWHYKRHWWQWFGVPVKWLYEVCYKDNNGEHYDINIYDPDAHMNISVTTTELAENVDWSESRLVYRMKKPLMEKISQGSIVVMAVVLIGALIFFVPFALGGD